MEARCLNCQSQLRVPEEFLGRRVKCPKCGAVFQVGQPPPVVEVEPVEGEQQSSIPATLKKKKKKARKLGFWERTFRDTSLVALVLCGICCSLPALIVGVIGYSTFTDPDARENAKILMISAGIGFGIGPSYALSLCLSSNSTQ